MRPRLGDSTVLEHDDAVRVADRRKTVRNGENRTARHHPVQRLLHELFSHRIERARRFVENQDRRILENRPRDRHTLLLAAGEPESLVADLGVVTVGMAPVHNEVMRIRKL